MTDLMLRSSLTHEQRDYAETLRSSADALLSILNDILDFSKIDAGKLSLDDREFNLHEILGEVMGTLSVRAQQKGLCRTNNFEGKTKRRTTALAGGRARLAHRRADG